MKNQGAAHSSSSRRRAFRTGLLSALVPGLGPVTLGDPGRGIIFLTTIFALLSGALFAVQAAAPAHKWATTGGGLALLLFAYVLNVIDAVRLARRSSRRSPTPLKWVILTGAYVGLALLSGFTLMKSEDLPLPDLYRVHSTSMSPNLLHGDYILVDPTSDCVDCEAALCRGDIVVFATDESTMIKRIVGLPGDRVEITDQTLRVNGHGATGATLDSLDNPELQHFHRSSTARTESLGPHEYVTLWAQSDPDPHLEVEVPPDHVFVLGDNRHHAKDSRTLGPIPVTRIKGRVDQAWLSRDRRSEVETPLFGPPLSFGSCSDTPARSAGDSKPRSTLPPPSSPNLLLITIDTLRADRVGSYGHAEATTPTLDGLAGLGVRFENAFTPFPRTTPALASLFTGLLPAHHGSRDVGQPIERGERFAEVLAATGYQTRAVSGTALAGAQQGFSQGFHDFDGLREDDPPLTATEVTRRALEAVAETDPERPTFLWVHYFDPHFPYRPPPGFPNQPIATECRNLTQKTLAQPRIQWSLHANWGGLAEAALSDCLALYDAEVHYTDTEIAQLLYGLGNLGFLKSVVIAVTADHGESFGESGTYYEHGATVHDATVRIPLILVGPDLEARVENELFSLEDLMPTLLGLLGVPPASRPPMDGADFSDRLRRDRIETTGSRLLYAESANTNKPPAFALPFRPDEMEEACRLTATTDDCSRFGGVGELLTAMRNVNIVTHELPQSPVLTRATQRIQERFNAGEARQSSVRDGHFKLVQAPRANGGFQRSLFDLRLDPLETRDISSQNPEQRAALDLELDAWLREIPEAPRHTPSPQQAELLRSLGYLE